MNTLFAESLDEKADDVELASKRYENLRQIVHKIDGILPMVEDDHKSDWAHIAVRNVELSALLKSKLYDLENAKRILNRESIKHAMLRLLDMYVNDGDHSIVLACTMARTHAKINTTAESERVRELQDQYDHLEFEKEHFHGKYIFPYELATEKAREYLASLLSKSKVYDLYILSSTMLVDVIC